MTERAEFERVIEAAADPIGFFQHWFQEAQRANVPQPEAMTVATATPDGRPSARMVLLRGLDERGFVFYTNYDSRKGEELRENPYAALVFFWPQLHRQVRVEGTVQRVSPQESAAYFARRNRGHQLSAWASDQSRPLQSRSTLEERMAAAESRFAGEDVPLPPYWGGFRVIPQRIEFWQGLPDRLHDRLVYMRDDEGWSTERLYP